MRTLVNAPVHAVTAILMVLALVALSSQPVRADAVVGTGTLGSCTEAALDAALAAGGTITFDCGGATTITVTSTKTFSADTTIDGGGLITISGGNSVGVFYVNTDMHFTVRNLTIANGKSAYGGGIENIDSGTLTVTNCTLSENNAVGIFGGGGGGAIENNSTLTITNSTFSGNNASDAGGIGYGGAIRNGSSGTVTITNSTFSGNNAACGGGILANGGTLTVMNSTFSDNSAVYEGGGIENNGGTLRVINSIFFGNNASGGGGGIDNYGTLTVTNSTFSSNNGGDQGGGIYTDGGTFMITKSTFSGNSASIAGGGIRAAGGRLTITNSTFSGNNASGVGGGGYGGGIDNGSRLTITNSTFFGNRATYGGGIRADSSTQITNSILANSPSGGNCSGIGITDGGYNIDDGATCGFTGTGCTDATGTSFCNTNPLLDPTGLKNNGGPSQTIALLPSSPAIDAGDEPVCAAAPIHNLDQRGYIRPGTGSTHCSIGAYEFNSPGPPLPHCVGDCNGDDQVTVNEIPSLVNILLGDADPSACAAGIPNGFTVNVALIIRAVTNLLSGCPGG